MTTISGFPNPSTSKQLPAPVKYKPKFQKEKHSNMNTTMTLIALKYFIQFLKQNVIQMKYGVCQNFHRTLYRIIVSQYLHDL